MNIDIGFWETRNGACALVVENDGDEISPWVGMVAGVAAGFAARWRLNGGYSCGKHCHDLVRPWGDKHLPKWAQKLVTAMSPHCPASHSELEAEVERLKAELRAANAEGKFYRIMADRERAAWSDFTLIATIGRG